MEKMIRGEYWPENDPTMSLEDARFSVLRYFAADIHMDLMFMILELEKSWRVTLDGITTL
jgi:hypothetical protein